MKESKPENNTSARERLKNALRVAVATLMLNTAPLANNTNADTHLPDTGYDISMSAEGLTASQFEPVRVHTRKRERINEDSILALPVPEPGVELLRGAKRGLILDKMYHRGYLYDNSKLIKTMAIGTANIEVWAKKSKSYAKTPTGFFKVHFKPTNPTKFSSSIYKPSHGAPPNMRWAVFFNGDIGTHQTNSSRVESDGSVSYVLDNSHGCVHLSGENAKLVYQTLKSGDPTVVINRSRKYAKEYIDGLRQDLDYKMGDIEDFASNNSDIKTIITKIPNLFTKIPDYSDLSKHQREKVYGPFEHSEFTEEGREKDPVIPLLRKDSDGVTLHGNAVRIGDTELATIVDGSVKILRNEAVRSALTEGKYSKMPQYEVFAGGKEELHGKWSVAFGYSYNENGKKWEASHTPGVIAFDKESNTLLFIAPKGEFRAFEQGMPIYSRFGDNFMLSGLATKNSELSNENVIVYELERVENTINTLDSIDK